MERTFFLVWCVHVLAVFAIFAGRSAMEVAQFDAGVKVNGLEVELVKPRHDGFSITVVAA
jgi:hypothetical protein